MINITELKKMLLSEVEEKKDLPGNQEKIAQAAEPKDKITAADFAALRAKKGMKEGDHEVSMAHNSLESIIKSAMELKAKLGNDERNIPGWIQDHITNAENYIDQASQGFHEISHDDQGEADYDELPDGTEEEPVDDMHNMSLAGLMENLMEATGWKSKDPHDKAKVKKVDGKFEVYTTQDGEIKTFKTEDEAKKFADKYNSKKIGEAKKPKKWIQKAIHPSKEGSLRKALGVKKGETIPAGKLAAAAKKGGKLGQRARLAQTLKKINK
jgi:hypothetical protein